MLNDQPCRTWRVKAEASFPLRVKAGTTPLMFAARQGNEALVDLLLEAGSDTGARSNVREGSIMAMASFSSATKLLIRQHLPGRLYGSSTCCREWISHHC